MEEEQKNVGQKNSKGMSWIILIVVGILVLILFGAVGRVIGVILIAIGIVRFISGLVKGNKK